VRALFRSWRGIWPALLPALGLGLLTAVGGLGLMGTSAYLIARAAQHPATVLLLLVPIAMVRGFSLLKAGARYGERVVAHDVTLQLAARLKVVIFGRLLDSPGRLATDRARGDWVARLSRDIDRLQNVYLSGIAPAAVLLFTAATGAVVLGHYVPAAGWVDGAGTVMAGAVLPAVVFRRERRRPGSLAEAEAALMADMVDLVEGLPDLVMAGLLQPVGQRLLDESRRQARRQRGVDRGEALLAGLSGAIGWGTAVGVLAASAPAVWAGQLATPLWAVLVFVALAGVEAVVPMTGVVAAFVETERAFERTLGENAGSPAAYVLPSATPVPDSLAMIARGVGVRYGAGLPWVLNAVDFVVPVGARIAIIGPSGSGKSTLLAVLSQLVPYERGSITIAGREVRDWAPDALYEHVTVLADWSHAFRASVAENLRMANPAASRARLEEVLEQVGLAARIASLPEGLDTRLGEDGRNLSGGEWQRLKVARVLLRDTPWLFLDEPLVGLDPNSRARVSEVLRDWARGKSVLYVTHEAPEPGWQFDAVWHLDAGHLREVSPEILGTWTTSAAGAGDDSRLAQRE
jgi:ATP-binding cassette subfamily C protein CydC